MEESGVGVQKPDNQNLTLVNTDISINRGHYSPSISQHKLTIKIGKSLKFQFLRKKTTDGLEVQEIHYIMMI